MNLCVIPARGGSQRVARKNVRDFRGKPMLHYPIETAKASGLFRLVVVSTDDDEIEACALQAGATVMRRTLDDGARGTQEVAAEVLAQFPYASLGCVIYPCSPLLDVASLKRGWRALQLTARPFAMSVDPSGADAGCFYWGRASAFGRTPLDASHTTHVQLAAERCCDLNTPEDWARAESMFDALRRVK